MATEHVKGKDVGAVMLYALSTCIWCRKTRQLLEELGIAYDYLYVDLLQGEERDTAAKAVKALNPALSFPTLLVNGRCIIGFRETDIREVFQQSRTAH